MKKIIYKIFGTRNSRLLKTYNKLVLQINNLEPIMAGLTDIQLQEKTFEFKQRYTQGETLNMLLPEAFAVCREASKRVLKMRHFDVQLIGGMVLHDGKIAEMRTGEGKTLVGTLSAYLNALSSLGVHVVTVNDYLARRDALDMGELYKFLGLSVGINLPNMSPMDKKNAYAMDITYGTNNEFGFDYLRDNMASEATQKVQRELSFAVIDEVDSILIDEARTPLIISGPAEGDIALYTQLNKIAPLLKPQLEEESVEGDFWVDEKNQNVILSEHGHIKIEQILIEHNLLKEGDSLYQIHNISLMHHLIAALRANYVYIKNQHYVVQNGEVIIVDEFTGRLMQGRRWSDGLHQAVEAKENVKIQQDNQTMATITFQNYFRMYKKLSGMTGTADTEAFEFQHIYNLETVVIPTNQSMIRIDDNDKIYMNVTDKYAAIINDVQQCHAKLQPVLIGTTSVENSEVLSRLLSQANLKHEVLNAKQNDREADIIAQAGNIGAITVATNMAGRGTDIVLGGNLKAELNQLYSDNTLTDAQKQVKVQEIKVKWQERNATVIQVNGLYIIGTERHESRRIDNQLRGRSGRQGDPGMSRFYLSLDDPLLRIFGGEKMRSMMKTLGMDKGESIEHKWLSRSIESAQRKVEGHNFDIRKQLLDYDDVSNAQRKVIYQQREEILNATDLSDVTHGILQGVIGNVVDTHIAPDSPEEMWDIDTLQKVLHTEFHIMYDIREKLHINSSMNINTLRTEIIDLSLTQYTNKLSALADAIKKDIVIFVNNMIGIDRDTWNVSGLDMFCQNNNCVLEQSMVDYVVAHPDITRDQLIEHFIQQVSKLVQQQVLRFERNILLQQIDYYWRNHLTALDQLRQGIHLRGYAQKDPKQEYKTESFNLFSIMLDHIKHDATTVLLTIEIQHAQNPSISVLNTGSNVELNQSITPPKINNNINPLGPKPSFVANNSKPLSRNAPCPCGSGKKYKHCCSKLQA